MSDTGTIPSEVKQVKVDNWGIYFLQRLKHFFNRTDYCDLTLQFQDNAQLKVHRLVLNACTEYFELLERTCEMYEDCLVMPDDLQADVVVPIVNFMYTGQLEFRINILEKLYQTSQIMNMPVLTKLLEAHRKSQSKAFCTNLPPVRKYSKPNDNAKQGSSPLSAGKRSYSKAFNNNHSLIRERPASSSTKQVCNFNTPPPLDSALANKKLVLGESRPTRYELPEELDKDNIFEDSFTNISYASTPLMVHPETNKRYSAKKKSLFSSSSGSKKVVKGATTLDIIECKRVSSNDNLFEDDLIDNSHDIFPTTSKISNQLFDQILENPEGPKVTIESKDKETSNLDHAKIISEVLKKYPHLVKSNKNIKLKILNTPNKEKKLVKSQTPRNDSKEMKYKVESNDTPAFTYETDVLDSKEAARLIAMGAENIKGPWICLICGTPGKALHFTSYYSFRRHLVEVHNEKSVFTICEYCGLKSLKRNYMLHHLYTKHNVEPPPSYHFPKCNICNYIALTEGFLVKHKMTHTEVRNFQCNACPSTFHSSKDLLIHIQNTGHKYSADRKANLQCVYCMKLFLREKNLYAHLKTNHKLDAKADCIIDDSDDDAVPQSKEVSKPDIKPEVLVKHEVPITYFNDFEEADNVQYEIQPDGKIQLINKKSRILQITPKQKILNAGFGKTKPTHTNSTLQNIGDRENEFLEDNNSMSSQSNDQHDEIVMIDDNQYVMQDNQLIPRTMHKNDYILPEVLQQETEDMMPPSTSVAYATMQTANIEQYESNDIVKKSKINQPIQIVVSNEEEYKALMSSNHSIIFDDGDSNKTLTVLTAPHGANLNAATVNMEANLPNDNMMIVQDGYPMNVTEAVTTGNSNIVVVYSHPVDEQSKQYQILDPELHAQYVQSTSMITQNYETVTTSTPVMSANVIDAQVEETWHDGDQNKVGDVVTIPAEMQTLTVIEQKHLETVESQREDNLHELPAVQIITHVADVAEATHETEAISVETNIENMEQGPEEDVVEEMIHHITTNPNENIETDTPIENNIIVSEEQQNNEVNETNNVETVALPIEEQLSETIQIPETVVDESDVNVIEGSENIVESIENMEVDAQNAEDIQICEENTKPIEDPEISMENVEVTEENIPEAINDTDTTTLIEDNNQVDEELGETNTDLAQNVEVTHDTTSPKMDIIDGETKISNPTEQIHHLTSEWSDDECESPEDQINNVDANSTTKTQVETSQEIPTEMEESIENIQKEVNKQFAEVEANKSKLAVELDPEETETAALPVTNIESQQKITSLLTDWDDNDSQEEISTGNVESTEDENEKQEVKTIEILSAQPFIKDDKIQNLVNDWDEEDEDNKV